MTTQYRLREDAADMDRLIESLTGRIEDLEREIVEARRRRDDLRFHRAEAMAAADVLDNMGFAVERDAAGVVTVRLAAYDKEAGRE